LKPGKCRKGKRWRRNTKAVFQTFGAHTGAGSSWGEWARGSVSHLTAIKLIAHCAGFITASRRFGIENALHERSSQVVIHTNSINIQKSSESVCRKCFGKISEATACEYSVKSFIRIRSPDSVRTPPQTLVCPPAPRKNRWHQPPIAASLCPKYLLIMHLRALCSRQMVRIIIGGFALLSGFDDLRQNRLAV
jgi:hypothetical protein